MYLIAYDISSNTVRAKVARRLIALGYERIQLSVFCGNNNPEHVRGLWQELKQWMASDPDGQLISLNIGPENFRNMAILGSHTLDFDFLLEQKNSLFI